MPERLERNGASRRARRHGALAAKPQLRRGLRALSRAIGEAGGKRIDAVRGAGDESFPEAAAGDEGAERLVPLRPAADDGR